MPKRIDFMFDEDTYKLLREAYSNGKTHAKPLDVEKLPKIIECRDDVYMNNKIQLSSIYGEMKDHGEKD